MGVYVVNREKEIFYRQNVKALSSDTSGYTEKTHLTAEWQMRFMYPRSGILPRNGFSALPSSRSGDSGSEGKNYNIQRRYDPLDIVFLW